MARDKNQSEGREKNDAVPAWEMTRGAGKGGVQSRPAQPDGSTAGLLDKAKPKTPPKHR